jgi:hypothetical protein
MSSKGIVEMCVYGHKWPHCVMLLGGSVNRFQLVFHVNTTNNPRQKSICTQYENIMNKNEYRKKSCLIVQKA